jgi:antitoxin component YwqK of YwqJK toxin-antitoxin module
MTYKNGIENGPCAFKSYYSHPVTGEYTMGKESGVWTDSYWEDNLMEKRTYASTMDTILSHRPLIRGDYMAYNRKFELMEKLDLQPEYSIPDFPMDFYEIPFENRREFELAGEVNKSHQTTDRTSYNYDYRMDNGIDKVIYDEATNRAYLRANLIDSLGIRYKYTGDFERYYGNGQLFFRYRFENGELLAEDTLFWDNGAPHDVITFLPDSNQLIRKVYDRKGIQYEGFIHDSLGNFVRYDEMEMDKTILIEGLLARRLSHYFDYELYGDQSIGFHYANTDTLKNELTGTVILSRTWTADTLRENDHLYNADTRTSTTSNYNVVGKQHSFDTKTFTENFEGWTGVSRYSYAGFESRKTISGVLMDMYGNDTLPQINVLSADWIYETAIDERMFVDDKPYTGAMKIGLHRGISNLKIKKNKVEVKLCENTSKVETGYRKAKEKAIFTGKLKKRFHLEYLTADGIASQCEADIHSLILSNSLLSPMLYDYREFAAFSIYEGYAEFSKMEGYYEDGKPHGIWTSYDQHGKVLSTLNFEHGDAQGELRIFQYQTKRPKSEDYYEYGWSPDYNMVDTFPTKKTRYMAHSVMYKKGQRDGVSTEFDWTGDVVSTVNFKNDLQNGFMYLNDGNMFSEASYKDGRLDGYLKTYLTFSDMDTTLLYDLNLQNGKLNGESRSYHINGQLAKRGFFLAGEPIDAYEAYDTLGFKYHYVKFQYGFPIEEKIWEENQLSIRYKFNWEDSIEFSPYDITSTESLESLLARRGYSYGQFTEEYFGRPRLLSKQNVECHMTKYYPNDTIARIGSLVNNKKFGPWKFYNYDGKFLYEVDYFDSIISLNDSIKFKSKGILTDYDNHGNRMYSAFIIEKFEKYDCAHTDHYEIRQLLTIGEVHDSVQRMNGYVHNFYDNGTLQGEGEMKNGVPTGLWKYYDPYGKLNKMGNYALGKRHGRWLEGDLSKKKYLGEICMNPNMPNLEKEKKYQENLLNVTIINYNMGLEQNMQFYDLDMNRLVEFEESRNDN